MLFAQSTINDLDVLNHSYGKMTCCDPACGDYGVNQQIRNSAASGTLHVFSGNNAGHGTPACTVDWPALRRDGLTVGATDSSNHLTPELSAVMWTGSSRGGMNAKFAGLTQPKAYSLIDLAAPGCFELMYSYNGSAAGYDVAGCGTSYSAPVVTGTAANVLDSFYHLGYGSISARTLQTFMILMADGWTPTSSSRMRTGMNAVSGAGRLRVHHMGNLSPPWDFGCHSNTIHHGQLHSYTVWDSGSESNSIKTWKAVLVHEEFDYTDASRLSLSVVNTCPSGGGGPVPIAEDDSYDVRQRIRLTSGDIGGKCLQFRVTGTSVKPLGVAYTVCDYFQSADDLYH